MGTVVMWATYCYCFYNNTWVNLPYLEVWKSGHRTADLGSLSHTFFRGLKLPTLAVWRPRSQTADLGSLMAGFQHFGAFGPQTADLGSFTAAFQPFAQSMMRCMFSNCRPWQFDGRFSALWPQTADLGSLMAGFQHCGSFGSQTADLGSSMAAFQPLSKVARKLPTLAVSWPLSSTCWTWQFDGFISFISYLHTTHVENAWVPRPQEVFDSRRP